MDDKKLRDILIETVRLAGKIHIKFRESGEFETEGKFGRDKKSIYDALTKADLESEKAAREFLQEKLPEFNFIGEEFGGDYDGSGRFVLGDMLDCTLGYGNGLDNFGSILSVYENGINIAGIVYNVMNDTIYVATRKTGFERIGSVYDQIPKGAIFIEGYMKHYPGFTDEMEKLIKAEFPGQAVIKNSPGVIHRAMVHNGECTAFFHTGLAPHDIGAEPIFGRLTHTKVTDHNGIPYESFDPLKVIANLESGEKQRIYANTILVAKPDVHEKMLGILSGFREQLDKVHEHRV